MTAAVPEPRLTEFRLTAKHCPLEYFVWDRTSNR